MKRSPDEQAAFDIIHRMTAEEKLRAAWLLYKSAYDLKYSSLKQLHPEWDEERVRKEAREAFMYARD